MSQIQLEEVIPSFNLDDPPDHLIPSFNLDDPTDTFELVTLPEVYLKPHLDFTTLELLMIHFPPFQSLNICYMLWTSLCMFTSSMWSRGMIHADTMISIPMQYKYREVHFPLVLLLYEHTHDMFHH